MRGAVMLSLVVLLGAAACQREPKPSKATLQPYMARMQRYSTKLGYSIEAKNGKLASFYVDALEELAEQTRRNVPTRDGQPIADQIESMLLPALPPVKQRLAAEDWIGAAREYGALIEHCNACHTKTGKGFIVIVPAKGPSPFSQKFEP